MKLGLTTDCMGHLSLEEMLQTCANLGLNYVELGCGAWSSAPHIDVPGLLASSAARSEYLHQLSAHDISIAALNCSGNPLDPGEKGAQHAQDVIQTFRLAEKLGVRRVVMMSGLPGGCPADRTPTWILTHWPPETADILKYQWDACIRYWNTLVPIAKDCGIEKIALEPHGWQLVYNVEGLRHLRANVSGAESLLGMNMDPSHPFWMGADPIEMVRELGELIFYCHIKDTDVRPHNASLNTMFDSKPGANMKERSWNFTIPGIGHGEQWWSRFVRELQLAGYDEGMSFEMEDHSGAPDAVLARGVDFMSRII